MAESVFDKPIDNAVMEIVEQISELNTVTQGSDRNITYYKVGKIDFVRISASLTESGQWITLGELPSGYRPSGRINFLCYDNSVGASTVAYTAIPGKCDASGAVTVWPYRESSEPCGSFMFVLT